MKMLLDTLKISDFRCFRSKEMGFGLKNILLGPNGSGKTSLLEAIHMLSLARSFRTADEQTMIRTGAENYHIKGNCSDGANRTTIETAASRNRQKMMKVDGNPVSAKELMGRFLSTVFYAHDIEMVEGPSVFRRKYLNSILCRTQPAYFDSLTAYNRLLKQKNVLLKKKTARCWRPSTPR